jgi:hypothetical protein
MNACDDVLHFTPVAMSIDATSPYQAGLEVLPPNGTRNPSQAETAGCHRLQGSRFKEPNRGGTRRFHGPHTCEKPMCRARAPSMPFRSRVDRTTPRESVRPTQNPQPPRIRIADSIRRRRNVSHKCGWGRWPWRRGSSPFQFPPILFGSEMLRSDATRQQGSPNGDVCVKQSPSRSRLRARLLCHVRASWPLLV